MLRLLVHPLLASLLAGLGSGMGPSAEAPASAAQVQAPEAESEAAAAPPDSAAPAQAIDTVLPCGLRVIAARDASLPVAAVVLAVEVGTRDDPKTLPGLVHALAYHLQQGNRELAPGEAIATAHDVGGLASMAVGPAQVRFEALVPVSRLDAQLRVESLRLRAPNVGRTLWLKSLSYANNDDRLRNLVPVEAQAAAWSDPGLGHDGRVVDRALGEMLEQAVGAQLSKLFDYRISTLVVVSPEAPAATLARVEPLFADLPKRPRRPVPAAAVPTRSDGPATVEARGQKGDSLLWAVPGTPTARAWAQVLCATLNRQQAGADEAEGLDLRCTYADDPRRPLLLVRAIGFDPAAGPEPAIAARLARVAAAERDEPELAALVAAQRSRIANERRFELRGPLDLAGFLAGARERRGPAPADGLRALDELRGLAGLPADAAAAPSSNGAQPSAEGEASPATAAAAPAATAAAAPAAAPDSGGAADSLAAAVPELFDTRRAVLLLAPGSQPPPPLHPPAATPSAGQETAPGDAGQAPGDEGNAPSDEDSASSDEANPVDPGQAASTPSSASETATTGEASSEERKP